MTRALRTTRLVLLITVLAAMAIRPAAAAAQGASQFSDLVHSSIDRSLRQLEVDHDFEAAVQRHREIFDQVIAFSPLRSTELFREAALAFRVVSHLREADSIDRMRLLRFLRQSPNFAAALAFAARPEFESMAEVYALADRLREQRGQQLETYANLAAAIAVVHDRPMTRRINENIARSADPIQIFDYFVANESKLLFGLRDVPVELLIYVVDCTASIMEMQWALNRYAGDTNVGARFFDIAYDLNHFRTGQPKRVTVAGWNLPNILSYGGVCADQAYFASTIGKAIGVPTTYTLGSSSEVAHAWVGFLQKHRGQVWWNFNAGRYDAYQGVRGNVLDPQIRRNIPDSYVSLLADVVTASTHDRQFAVAAVDAARRLIALLVSEAEWPASEPMHRDWRVQRVNSVNDVLMMIEAGLRACPGYADGWFTVRQLAADGLLSLEDKKRWAEVLHRLCGNRYPDFYLTVAAPMIESIDDPGEQDRLWNNAFRMFQNRADLAAAVRMSQAEMWLRSGEPVKAGRCYEDVIIRYANAGPFVIGALRGAERILREGNEGAKVLTLYEQTWSRIRPPRQMGGTFARQSNWIRVGRMYAERLEEAGQRQKAAEVRGRLNAGR